MVQREAFNSRESIFFFINKDLSVGDSSAFFSSQNCSQNSNFIRFFLIPSCFDARPEGSGRASTQVLIY